ncbi:MAG: HAD-IA family hydrolase [Catenulispora sp.]|nr:HAD-IA family hydrolase [Catenulispora sp.]
MSAPAALVFDFDGLLMDTESAALRAWQAEFEARGTHLPTDVWRSGVGRRDSHSILLAYLREQIGSFDAEEVGKSWRARLDASLETEGLREGVRDYLDAASRLGLRLAVASSATADWVLGHLERVGVRHRFDVITCGDDHPPKPRPDIYLATVAALGVRAGAAIAFEDSPPGVTSAKAAGLHCVAVPNPATATLTFEGADRIIASFTQLPSTLLISG